MIYLIIVYDYFFFSSEMQESQQNKKITGLLNQVLLTPRSDIPGTR